MLESGEVLLTWQLLRDPTDPAGYPIPARRIGDHRKFYLIYEGPLTGNRGTVRRVDSGAVNFLETAPESCRFTLSGDRLQGAFILSREAEGWTFEAARVQ